MADNGVVTTIDDCVISKVEREGTTVDAFKAHISSKKWDKYKWTEDSKVTISITYASKIDKTLANSSYGQTATFRKMEHELGINGAKITVPHTGDKFQFGSSEIEVIDVASSSENDSLVLMITYGDTKFLFTGDIEDDAQTRISDKYENDEAYKINLIKMPHHGSSSPQSVNGTGSLYRFIRTFMPDYADATCQICEGSTEDIRSTFKERYLIWFLCTGRFYAGIGCRHYALSRFACR